MVIELFYVPGCPNRDAALQRLRSVLRSAAINAPLQQIAVTDDAMARGLKFPGSPTIRVDGIDAEPYARDSYGIACRLYANGTGVPSLEALQGAIDVARKGKV